MGKMRLTSPAPSSLPLRRTRPRPFQETLMSAICRFRPVVAGLCFLTCLSTTTPAADIPVWGVFEQELTATTDHDNPFTAKVVVQFRGPSGREHARLGFWDGGRTWRVRFCPDEAGTWTWKAGGDADRLGWPT